MNFKKNGKSIVNRGFCLLYLILKHLYKNGYKIVDVHLKIPILGDFPFIGEYIFLMRDTYDYNTAGFYIVHN